MNLSSERGVPVSGSKSSAPTVLGKDAVVNGKLTSDADMLIEGRVEGQINGGKEVIIGESGDVEAQVRAEVVTVRGKVTGDCEATKKGEITATGTVFGNISARAIVVAEGATFRGASKMTSPVSPSVPAEPNSVTKRPATTERKRALEPKEALARSASPKKP
jgi:cytoskeletal protein CcmA (bactofilin family)